MSAHYDVIIVGGRPAGASLAVRLAAHGVSVLVIDRARFPSLPAVPSSPILYPAAMAELDALGVPAQAYDRPEARMRSLTFSFHPWWQVVMQVPPLRGRDYLLGVNRRDLDAATWALAGSAPSCELREGWTLRDLLRDEDGRVCGVTAAGPDGEPQELRAGCVVGADGRYSHVARRAGAPIVDERDAHTSTVYYADWEGVGPDAAGQTGGQVVTTGRGLDVLLLCMPDGRTCINTHSRSDRTDVAGDPQGWYASTLRALPEVQARLAGARQVSKVVGIKRVGNGYRQAYGDGWVLVGDALHYKDPVDGQGIYDALVQSRLLAEALLSWRDGRPWGEAMAGYAKAVDDATRLMFQATTERLRRELYQEPPAVVIRTLIRWWMSDPEYQLRFLQYLDRDLPPDRWLTPGVALGAALRGVGRDLRGWLGGAG